MVPGGFSPRGCAGLPQGGALLHASDAWGCCPAHVPLLRAGGKSPARMPLGARSGIADARTIAGDLSVLRDQQHQLQLNNQRKSL